MKKILIVTGGTGGHVIPAQVLYQYLNKNNYSVHMAVDTRGNNYLTEKPKYLWTAYNKNFFKRTYYMIRGFFKSLWIVPKYDIIIVFGTYFSVPFIINSILFRKKFYIHDQNIILSRISTLFAKFSYGLMVSWPVDYNIPATYVGLPIRKYTLKKSSKFKILIVFGSQESPILYDILMKIFKEINNDILSQITVVTSPNNFKKQDLLLNVEYFTTNFNDNIMDMYGQCSMAIGRGGAGFLYEMMAMKKPTITIPIKNSINNHQYYNSKFMEDSGLGVMYWNDQDEKKCSKFIEKSFNNFKNNDKNTKKSYVIKNSCENILNFIKP